MPIFLPRIPVTAMSSSPHHAPLKRAHCRVAIAFTHEGRRRPTRPASLFESLDLYIHTGGQIEFHQRVYCLLGGFEDIDQPLVRADLKGLARFLVNVRRTQ